MVKHTQTIRRQITDESMYLRFLPSAYWALCWFWHYQRVSSSSGRS